MSYPNAALLRATLARIEANPDEFDSEDGVIETVRGTTYDFAATAIRLVYPKAEFHFTPVDEFTPGSFGPEVLRVAQSVSTPGNSEHHWHIEGLAQLLLGIAWADDLFELFDPDNTIADIHRRVHEICAGTELNEETAQ